MQFDEKFQKLVKTSDVSSQKISELLMNFSHPNILTKFSFLCNIFDVIFVTKHFDEFFLWSFHNKFLTYFLLPIILTNFSFYHFKILMYFLFLTFLTILTNFCFWFQIPCPPLPCHDYHHSPTDPNGSGLRRQLLDLPNERRWYGMPSERHQHQN